MTWRRAKRVELINPSELPLVAPARQVMSVSELTTQIKGVLEPSFHQVWIQGEVSNYRPASSGHIYFSLKDEGASISVAAFGWGGKKNTFAIKDGLKICCRGKISIYPPRGNYQLIVDQMEPLGLGLLQANFEKLKAQLAAEGLFDLSRKRPLPSFPSSILVITSPSGAAIQDMIQILRRRAPQIKIIIVPALVQGNEAPAQMIRALESANQSSLGDLIVLARGGGSMEDLWCFNHEELARAIARSRLPVMSAVGHEIDFTIADFVSDLRAPTPSAAAEILSEHWVKAVFQLKQASDRLQSLIKRDLSNRRALLSHIAARVVSPRDRLREQAQKLDELSHRLDQGMQVRMERQRGLLQAWAGKLDALSPLKVLERGYALVKAGSEAGLGSGKVIKSAFSIRPGQELEITFYDGQRAVRAI